MIIWRQKLIPFGKFGAFSLWPIIFTKIDLDERTLNHEKIHGMQCLEMLWVFWLPFYALEWTIKFLITWSTYRAYRSVSFEQEAYENDANLSYRLDRPIWAWKKWVFTLWEWPT